ncbi:hypothetical protein [Allopontixanthobacter sp.]|uniref:hypothetical protein n=1 Tax=Allopontixanthobacter sp. TaxID=2906452 RepID=UPI002ABC31A2|nr:hypothetical protein [Allopontixanthobacter sp.]MDZ4307715.1 hypothetical protein [Allopontixanthobacter sp.]
MNSLPPLLDMAIWGLAGTISMTGILFAANGLGLSRLSIPFLVGGIFTANRQWANLIGFALYLVGGWGFALFYFLFFSSIGIYSWWIGAAVGFLHGLFLLVAALPLMPFVHPRMASSYDAPVARPQLEPPGFLGLHYGGGTPAAVLAAQIIYGTVLGGLPQLGLTAP